MEAWTLPILFLEVVVCCGVRDVALSGDVTSRLGVLARMTVSVGFYETCRSQEVSDVLACRGCKLMD